MLPLLPVQRRTLDLRKNGRAITVARSPAETPPAGIQSDGLAEKRRQPDRRRQSLPVDEERRRGDRRGQRRRMNPRLKAILAHSENPPAGNAGQHINTSV